MALFILMANHLPYLVIILIDPHDHSVVTINMHIDNMYSVNNALGRLLQCLLIAGPIIACGKHSNNFWLS